MFHQQWKLAHFKKLWAKLKDNLLRDYNKRVSENMKRRNNQYLYIRRLDISLTNTIPISRVQTKRTEVPNKRTTALFIINYY